MAIVVLEESSSSGDLVYVRGSIEMGRSRWFDSCCPSQEVNDEEGTRLLDGVSLHLGRMNIDDDLVVVETTERLRMMLMMLMVLALS